MALRVDYVVRETATNLKRNLTLDVRDGRDDRDRADAGRGIAADEARREPVERPVPRQRADDRLHEGRRVTGPDRRGRPRPRSRTRNVQSKRYLDHDEANAGVPRDLRRRARYPRQPHAGGDADQLQGARQERELRGRRLAEEPVPRDARASSRSWRTTTTSAVRRDSFAKFRSFSLLFAAIVGATSLVLIVNSIRIAMFARRREIEVMKLVGATNWFIRIPFMAEGLVQGIVGGAAGHRDRRRACARGCCRRSCRAVASGPASGSRSPTSRAPAS